MADRPPRPRVVWQVVLGLTALIALVFWVPFLSRSGEVVVSMPGPAPVSVVTPIPMPTDKSVCVNQVTLTPAVAQLRIAIQGPRGKPAGPLDVVLVDGDLRMLGRGSAPAGFVPPTPVLVPVTQHIPHPTIGYVCFTNRGHPLDALGSNEIRLRTRSQTAVDQVTVVGGMTLTVLGRPASLGSRLGDVVRAAAGFWPLPAWLVGLLALVCVLGIPGLLALALIRALRDGQPS